MYKILLILFTVTNFKIDKVKILINDEPRTEYLNFIKFTYTIIQSAHNFKNECTE